MEFSKCEVVPVTNVMQPVISEFSLLFYVEMDPTWKASCVIPTCVGVREITLINASITFVT
eukprot:2581234-Ditylum_brightwellii.AAC.1